MTDIKTGATPFEKHISNNKSMHIHIINITTVDHELKRVMNILKCFGIIILILSFAKMSLVRVLQFKILATFFAWCLPLIFFPAEWIIAAGFPSSVTGMLTKLLGWAYLALLVGYSFGLKSAMAGQVDKATICMGIVSNFGAGIIMISYGFQGHFQDWGAYAQFHMWASASAVLLISAGLYWYGRPLSHNTQCKTESPSSCGDTSATTTASIICSTCGNRHQKQNEE